MKKTRMIRLAQMLPSVQMQQTCGGLGEALQLISYEDRRRSFAVHSSTQPTKMATTLSLTNQTFTYEDRKQSNTNSVFTYSGPAIDTGSSKPPQMQVLLRDLVAINETAHSYVLDPYSTLSREAAGVYSSRFVGKPPNSQNYFLPQGVGKSPTRYLNMRTWYLTFKSQV